MQDAIITDATKAKLNDLLGYVADGVKAGGDMLAREAPEVAKEIVAWKLSMAYATVIGCVVGLIVATILVWFTIRKMSAESKSNREGKAAFAAANKSVYESFEGSHFWACSCPAFFIPAAFLLMICSIGLCFNVAELIKCHAAPRLVVLDYLRESVK